jgi:hypothetical protein
MHKKKDIFDKTCIKKGFDEDALISVNKYLAGIYKYMSEQFYSKARKIPSKLKIALEATES